MSKFGRPTSLRALDDEAEVVGEYERPRTRADCLPGGPNEQRPCPFVGCSHHLALSVNKDGSVHVVGDWDDGRDTCVLDVIDRNEQLTMEAVGELFGVTRERIRQVEAVALEKFFTRYCLNCGQHVKMWARRSATNRYLSRFARQARENLQRPDAVCPNCGCAQRIIP